MEGLPVWASKLVEPRCVGLEAHGQVYGGRWEFNTVGRPADGPCGTWWDPGGRKLASRRSEVEKAAWASVQIIKDSDGFAPPTGVYLSLCTRGSCVIPGVESLDYIRGGALGRGVAVPWSFHFLF